MRPALQAANPSQQSLFTALTGRAIIIQVMQTARTRAPLTQVALLSALCLSRCESVCDLRSKETHLINGVYSACLCGFTYVCDMTRAAEAAVVSTQTDYIDFSRLANAQIHIIPQTIEPRSAVTAPTQALNPALFVKFVSLFV